MDGSLKARLVGQWRQGSEFGDVRQCVPLDKVEVLSKWKVAVEKEGAARRMVKRLMEFEELFVREVGDFFWIAARIVCVGQIGKQMFGHFVPKFRFGMAHGAFHLVVDNAMELESVIGEFQSVPFLKKTRFLELRIEDGIEIDFKQVVKVLLDLGTGGVTGEILAGQRVHERIEAAPIHGKKGVFHGIFFGAAEDGVFEDVGHAIGATWQSLEREAEEIFRVVIGDVHDLGPRGLMDELNQCAFEFGKGEVFRDQEVAIGLADTV